MQDGHLLPLIGSTGYCNSSATGELMNLATFAAVDTSLKVGAKNRQVRLLGVLSYYLCRRAQQEIKPGGKIRK